MNDEPANAGTDGERTEKLPEEILGAHESRFDALKWKLLLVAALGAAGLGLQENQHPIRLLLALIPFVCIYVDLICTTLKVRVMVIGAFYAHRRRDDYERFAQRNRAAYQMEDWALDGSTKLICWLIFGIGLILLLRFLAEPPGAALLRQWPFWSALIVLGSGLWLLERRLTHEQRLGRHRMFLWVAVTMLTEAALLPLLPAAPPWQWPLWEPVPILLVAALGVVATGWVKRLEPYRIPAGCALTLTLEAALLLLLPADLLWQWPFWEPMFLILAGASGAVAAGYTLATAKRLIADLSLETDVPEPRKPDAPGRQNPEIVALMRPAYDPAQLTAVRDWLTQKGVFIFQSLPNGLFPAAANLEPGAASGYQNVWVRDNINVAHAHYVCGDKTTAARTLTPLMRWFQKSRGRFQAIIADPARAKEPMNRPHIRFDGTKLEEIKAPWPHAQNDALGAFLWCYCKLARAGDVPCGGPELECLAEFPLYFQAIEYWRDTDSGHWEEQRKVSASSIGAVLAGLREFDRLLKKKPFWSQPPLAGHRLTPELLYNLRQQGVEALGQILPCEALTPADLYRRYDSALLFLIYPLEAVEWAAARVILEDVQTHLQGEYGIRRYLGDSYWRPDYKERFKPEQRAAETSQSTAERDAGMRVGEEAQWCIFDPILSVIYGQRYLRLKQTGPAAEAAEMLRLQTCYFNRALGQVTGPSDSYPAGRTPEAYYLEHGHYVPNDQTPLLWTQANLWLALHQMQSSVAAAQSGRR